MFDHYQAMRVALEAGSNMSATRVYLMDVETKPSYPYVVLWGPPVGLPGQRTIRAGGDIRERVYATCVGDTAAGALIVARNVVNVLGGERPKRLHVPGRSAWLELHETRPVEKDTNFIVPGTNENPKFTVLVFLLHSTPQSEKEVTDE